jgi:carboxymethylenebutenolidase
MTTAAPPGSLGRYETYTAPEGTAIESYLVVPEKTPAPAVLMLRGVAGPDSGYTQIADKLAAAGYAALVHKWQVRGDDPSDEVLIGDIAAAIAFLQAQPRIDGTKIAIFGYCKGGGQGLLAAAALTAIRAVVAFHGFARRPGTGADDRHGDPIAKVGAIDVPVLLLHGENDQLSPVGNMRDLADAFTACGKSAVIHTYAAADHGFAVSTHKGYVAAAADDGFARGVAFLDRQFKGA